MERLRCPDYLAQQKLRGDIWGQFGCRLRFASFAHASTDVDLKLKDSRGADTSSLSLAGSNIEV